MPKRKSKIEEESDDEDYEEERYFFSKRTWSSLIWFTTGIRTYILLPFLQGVMLGLGQHGTRYLLSSYLLKKQIR